MKKSIFAVIFTLILSTVSNAQGTVTVLRKNNIDDEEFARTMANVLEVRDLTFGESNSDVAFEKILAIQEKIGARIVPAFDDGRLIGFQIFNIYPGSVFEKLGLEEKDIIVAINGKKTASEASSPQTLRDTNP